MFDLQRLSGGCSSGFLSAAVSECLTSKAIRLQRTFSSERISPTLEFVSVCDEP